MQTAICYDVADGNVMMLWMLYFL